MKEFKRILISRSSDCSDGGGFGFTLRHFVIYPSSISVNDILQASYSVVIDEHQQKQLEERRETKSAIIPSTASSASSGTHIYYQREQQQQQEILSPNSMKTIGSDNVEDKGTTIANSNNENIRSIDTIFVKEVRSDSLAYNAGLRSGDRILSVNDQSIHGKTYSQVISIIQNTPNDLILNVVPKPDDTFSVNAYEPRLSLNRSSSYCSSTTNMSKNTIEQKLRNLQIKLAQGRTQEELAQAGIYFPPPDSSSSQNTFSNYIDSVHKALDLSKQSSKEDSTSYYQSPYHDEYIPYDYKKQTSFQQQKQIDPSYIPLVNSSLNIPSQDQTQWLSSTSSQQEFKSSSADSLTNDKSSINENDTKTEFVNFRKKQFETGHVENLVHDTQRESKTKKYSEKKKYENEWNRLTAVADVDSVMKRAAHFEDIDPDKFARLKSKLPNSPLSQDTLTFQDDYLHDINPNQIIFYDAQPQSQFNLIKPISTSFDPTACFSFPRVDETNTIEYNYDYRYMIEPMQRSQSETAPTTSSSHYGPLTTNENSQRYTTNNYSPTCSSRTGGSNLIRQDSYITAVKSAHQNEHGDFVNLHALGQLDFSFSPETPTLRRKVSQYGRTPETSEQQVKQRRTSYLIATDQRIRTNRDDFVPSDMIKMNKNENYSYDAYHEQQQQQKSRNASHHQTQAIKKLKNFFGEATPEVTHALDHRSLLSSPLSSMNQSKSASYFDNSTSQRESISLTTLADNLEASKEGILYCKTALKDGRRAADRSWRGAWAVLRRGALFLGKEKKHGLLIPLSCDSFPISLRNADVELASDYIKKPRVFKLITSNHSEYLFQAPDLQSLTEWLNAIKENCIFSQSEQDNQQLIIDNKGKFQRISTSSLPPIAPTKNYANSEQDLRCQTEEQFKPSPLNGRKSKSSLRSPSIKRSPSVRFRKSQKSSIPQPTQAISSLNNLNSPSNVSPRRSFVKSIVKKGLRTLKSSSSLLTNQMSGQIYDESSGESLSSTTGASTLSHGINFSIELEECESSSVSRYIPIVVEILTRLVELRGINCQGIYRHAGGLTAVNWLVHELDKGVENVEFNSEKWYDVKAVASTLKTFFAKLPDSLLSSKMSSLCVEASRTENHCDRLLELKRLSVQLDDYRLDTLKYLCAHFRRVASKCHINKIDARNLAIIFGPTLIWNSQASLQSNLVDNPEKIRIIESFILYYEWFFDYNDYNEIPVEINPQMPKLPPVLNTGSLDLEISLNDETKPSEIIQQIVRAAKRRWSSPLLLDSLSSLSTTTEQQTSKPINISVKRNRRQGKKEEKSSRSRSVDSSLNGKQPNQAVSSSTDSAVYSMSDISSSISTTIKKPSQSLKDISHFFHYFTLSNEKYKSKTLTNIRRKKLRKKLSNETFISPTNKNDDIYERISNSSICFIDQTPIHEVDFAQQTSLLKSKLIQHENVLKTLKQQISQVDQQLLIIQEDSIKHNQEIKSFSPSNHQLLKRRHTFNSLFDLNCLFTEKDKCSSSSLYALQLL
ncbi:unnamed protein product [Rotaria magnacalcarata]|uniref:Uncharacterized protein n=2 Tax=Rotaria magnacalcarata TaxID=392030 RepID=A0A819KUU9_9BILA|nr:unnamed protein product [Rotaria magnacalcarata]